MMRLALAALAACYLIQSACYSAEYFVNAATGNNGNAGTSAGAPKLTIQAGIDAASAGDTVTVAAGIYTENPTVNKASLVLRGAQQGQDGRTRTVVLANETVLRPASLGTPTLYVNADGVVVDGLLVEGNTQSAGVYLLPTFSGYQFRNSVVRGNVYGMELDSNGTTQTVVERNLFTQNNVPGAANGNGIYSDQGLKNVLIRNNNFIDNFNAAVLITGVGFPPSNNRVTVEGNTMEDCGIGVLLTTTDTATVSNNTITNCNNGVQLSGDTDTVTVSNNVFTDSVRRAIVAASQFGFNNNANLTFTGNRILQDAGVLNANRSLIDLTDVAGQNRIESNYLSVSGAFGSGVTRLDGIRIAGSLSGDFRIVANELLGGNVDTADGTTDSSGVLIESTISSSVLVLIQRNTVQGWVNSIESAAANSNGGIRIDSNAFAAGETAVKNTGAGPLTAQNNWFGAASGPTATANAGAGGGAVSGSVNYSPWLASGTDLSPLIVGDSATYGFQLGSSPVLSSLAPRIESPASVAPNPLTVEQTALFAVVGSDPDGGTLSVAWDFGDGANGSGWTVTHAYTTPGVYSATVSITDATGGVATSTVSVTVAAAATPQPTTEALILLKSSINAAVPSKNRDTLSLSGSFVLPAGTTSLDGTVAISAGTFSATLPLVKGKGKSNVLTYSHKTKRVQKKLLREALFKAKSRGNFQAVLEAAGVTATTSGSVTLPVQIQFAGVTYAGSLVLKIKSSTKKYQARS